MKYSLKICWPGFFRWRRVVIPFFVWFFLTVSAFGFSYRGMSEAEMTCRADAIVTGRLTEENRGSNLFGVLRVERVLKGQDRHPGDVLEFMIQPMAGIDLPQRQSHAVVWLSNRDKDRFVPVNFSNSIRKVEEKTIDSIQANLGVLADPKQQLARFDTRAAPALHCWIQRHWFKDPFVDRPRDPDPVLRIGDVDRREIIAYLLRSARQAEAEDRPQALTLLASFAPGEAYRTFIDALRDDSCNCQGGAMRGLARLRDRRAVGPLMGFLDRNPHATEWEETAEALRELGNRSMVPALLKLFRQKPTWPLAAALSKIGDRRALPALLRYQWRQMDDDNGSLVLSFRDSGVLAQARARIENHPAAPYIVAASGDLQDKEFMRRLLLQGHRAGLRWAVQNGSAEARGQIVQAMLTVRDRQFLLDALAGLGKSAVSTPGQVRAALRLFRHPAFDTAAVTFLEGRLSLPPGPSDSLDDRRGRLARRLRDDASRHGLGGSEVAALEIWGFPRRPLSEICRLPEERSWPRSEDAGAREAFQELYGKDLARCVMEPSGFDYERSRLLVQIASRQLPILSRQQVHELLAEPFDAVQFGALEYCASLGIELAPEEVRGLFHSQALEAYVRQMGEGRIRNDPELLVALLEEPWALGMGVLYDTIVRTKTLKAAAPLKGLLRGNTVETRRNAAVTLAYLGDKSGRGVLRQELERARAMSYQHYGWIDQLESALAALRR